MEEVHKLNLTERENNMYLIIVNTDKHPGIFEAGQGAPQQFESYDEAKDVADLLDNAVVVSLNPLEVQIDIHKGIVDVTYKSYGIDLHITDYNPNRATIEIYSPADKAEG